MKSRKILSLVLVLCMVFSLFASAGSYTVKSGDMLWKIAKANGTTWQELAKINNLKNPNLIFAGQTLVLDGSAAPAGLKDGTYEASAPGMVGDVTVAVTVSSGKISAVKIVKQNETSGISDPAIAKIPPAIVAKNSASVDSVAGATITSQAIMKAAAKALEKAAGKEVAEVVKPVIENPDVLIVGAGFSGMNAALEAAELGGKVILFEKNPAMGGSIKFAGGTMSGADTQMQRDAKVVDSEELFYKDIERLGGGIFIPELTKKHISKAADAISWMESIGATFGDRLPKQPQVYEAFGIPREHRVDGGGKAMAALVDPLIMKQVDKGNISLLLKTTVTDIIIENGAVVGVTAKGEDGVEKTYRAKSTILATGGYGYNEAWVHEYNFKNALTDAPPHATGDGYNFAKKAGAKFSNMDYLPAYPGGVPLPEKGFVHDASADIKEYPGAIWVNKNGVRMIDEFDNSPAPVQEIWAKAPDNLVYIIIDEAMKKANKPLVTAKGTKAAMATWEYFDELAAKGEIVFKADTIEELAKKANVDAAALKATITKYNSDVAAGKDSAFGRVKSLQALNQAPYYMVKTVPYLMLTKGGPLMNANAQTLNAEGKPIVGLYQTGELVGGANLGGAASIGGLANTTCVVWGKIAAQSAVEFAKK